MKYIIFSPAKIHEDLTKVSPEVVRSNKKKSGAYNYFIIIFRI